MNVVNLVNTDGYLLCPDCFEELEECVAGDEYWDYCPGCEKTFH